MWFEFGKQFIKESKHTQSTQKEKARKSKLTKAELALAKKYSKTLWEEYASS